MSTGDPPQNELPLVCNPDAIPSEERALWIERGRRIYAAVEEIQDMPQGYGLRLPASSAMMRDLAEYLANERLCCAFLHFTLEIEPGGGPFWLRLTGSPEVKTYLRSLVATSDLFSEGVFQASKL